MKKKMKKLLIISLALLSISTIKCADAAGSHSSEWKKGTIGTCSTPGCKAKFWGPDTEDHHKRDTGHGVDVTAGRSRRVRKPSAAVQRALANRAKAAQDTKDALRAKTAKTGKMKSKPRARSAHVNPMGVAAPKTAAHHDEGLLGRIQGWGEEVAEEVAKEMESAWYNFEGLFQSEDATGAIGTPSPVSLHDSGHGSSLKPTPTPSPVQLPSVHVVPTEEDDAWMNSLIPNNEFVEERALRASPEFEKNIFEKNIEVNKVMHKLLEDEIIDDFNPAAAVDEEELFIPDVDVDDLNVDDIDLYNFEGLRLPE